MIRNILTGMFFLWFTGILPAQQTLSELCPDCRIQLRASGNTYGLVYSLHIQNTSNRPISFTIPCGYIPVDGHQPVAVPQPVMVDLNTGQGRWYDINGYCLDVMRSTSTVGTHVDPGKWIIDPDRLYPVWQVRYAFYNLYHQQKLPGVIYKNPNLHEQIIQQAIWVYYDGQGAGEYDRQAFGEKFAEAAQVLSLEAKPIEELSGVIWSTVQNVLSRTETLPGPEVSLHGFQFYDDHFLLPPDIAYPLLLADIELPQPESAGSETWHPAEIVLTSDPIHRQIELTFPDDFEKTGASSVSVSLSEPTGQTDFLPLEQRAGDRLYFSWPNGLVAGYYTCHVAVKNDKGHSVGFSEIIPAGDSAIVPEFSESEIRVLYQYDVGIMATVTPAEVRRARGTVDDIEEDIDDEYDGIRTNENEIDRLRDSLFQVRLRRNELQRIDRILEGIPLVYRHRIEDMLDSMKQIERRQGRTPDTLALQRAVDQAQSRLDDCLDHVAELRQQQANLEVERDALKEEQDALLEQINDLFTENGWDGGYGYHDDGGIGLDM